MKEKKILVYDDDLEILLLCKVILEKNGYTAVTKNRADDVVQEVVEVSPDIILMDLWIPEIGGEKAAQLLKTTESTKHIPLLLFSANADIDIIAENVGASSYIAKPFSIKDFLEKIQSFL